MLAGNGENYPFRHIGGMVADTLQILGDHAVNIAKWAIFCVTGELS